MKAILKPSVRFNPLYPPWGSSWHSFILLVFATVVGMGIARLPLLWAGSILLLLAAVVAVAIRPIVGLALALLAGPLGALENIWFGGTVVDSGQLLLLLALGAWLGQRLLNRRVPLAATRLNLPLFAFIFIAALSVTRAPSITLGLKELLKWVEIGLIMLVVMDMVAGSSRRDSAAASVSADSSRYLWVLWMLLLAGLSQAIVGIWQFALRGTGPEHFQILGRFYRAYGTYEQPNPFGGFMNLTGLLAWGVLIGLAVAWWQQRRSRQKGLNEGQFPICPAILVGGAAVTATTALVFSWSRGAWLGFAAGGLGLVLFGPRRRSRGLLLLVLIAALAAGLLALGTQMNLLPEGVLARIGDFRTDLQFGDVRGVDINSANYAVLERLAHWQAAVDMAVHNLWLGVGFGNYELAYPDYALINWPDALGHAHNYYLNILAEAGILGLVTYLLLWAAVFWQTLRLLRILTWPARGIALGLLTAWISLSVHHLVDKLYVNNIYVHLGVMLGLLQVLDRKSRGDVSGRSQPNGT